MATRATMPTDAIVSFRKIVRSLRACPGQTCDQLAARHGVPPAVMAGALVHLRRLGHVRGEGATRARGYYAAGAT